MADVESRLLSKIINENEYGIVAKANLSVKDFYSQSETFNFIRDYYKSYGEVPPFTTVVEQCEKFEYEPEVPDHFNYLTKTLKNNTAKRKAFTLLQDQAGDKFSTLKGVEFINWLHEEVTQIKAVTNVEIALGTNFATNGAERKEEYLSRKENRSNVYIPTPYSELNNWLGGGNELGDYVLLMAYSNVGKSWVGSHIALHGWKSGFGVLHYSPELSKKQQLDRLDTLNGHFDNTLLKQGSLQNEEHYLQYLDGFTDNNEVPYLVKTMGDLPKGVSVDVIEADLQANENIKMVVIDGFNLMRHVGADGTRNNMSNTSRRLRQLFGKYGVVGLVVHQTTTSAKKENTNEDESGARILKCPELTDYSETVSCIQDACTVLTLDAFGGQGKLKLAKARTPNVGKELELHCDFNYGKIAETSIYDFI